MGRKWLLLALAGALAALGLTMASDSFSVPWDVVGGGGDGGQSDSFRLQSTIGQVAPGVSQSESFRLEAGYWPGLAAAAAPAPSPTPSPTPPAGAAVWGDVDCDGAVNAVDALKLLRHVVGLPVSQTEPCPDIGSTVTLGD